MSTFDEIATLFDTEPEPLKPWQGGPAARLERLAPEDRFDGRTYDPELDAERLGAQLVRVWRAVKGGHWHTLAELAAATGDPEASVSARLRDLRKRKLGGYTVERRRVGGTFHYRLALEEEVNP